MAWIRCPHCATLFDLAIARPGTVTDCPHCKRPCRLPGARPGGPVIPAVPPPAAAAVPQHPPVAMPPPAPPAPRPSVEVRPAPPAAPPKPAAPTAPAEPPSIVPRLEIDPDPQPAPPAPAPKAPVPSAYPPPPVRRRVQDRGPFREIEGSTLPPLDLDPPTPLLEIDADPPPAPPPAIAPQPQVPILDLDAELPEPPLEIDPEPAAAPLAHDPAAVPSLPIPLLEIDPPEEEVLTLPPECVEEGPEEDASVEEGVVAEEDAEEAEIVGEADETEGKGLDYGEQPRRRKPRRKRKRPDHERVRPGTLDRVNLGLLFHYIRIVVMLAGIALLLFGLAIGMFTAGMGSIGSRAGAGNKGTVLGMGLVAFVFLLVAFAFKFVTPVLGLVGSSLCMGLPRQTGAWGFMLASLILDAVAAFVGLILLIPGVVAWLPGIAILAALPTFLMSFTAWVLFMIALNRLSASLKEEAMAEEAVAVLLRGAGILVAAPAVLGLLMILAGTIIGGLFAPVILLGSLYCFFLFLQRQLDLVGSLRQVICSRW